MKWYEKSSIIILFLIIFFPVGLYLMCKYANWKPVVKVIVTAVLAVCLIVSFSSIIRENANKDDNLKESTTVSQTTTSNEENTTTTEVITTTQAQLKEVDYEITYQNASTYKSKVGTVWVSAIWEVTNTGSKALCLGVSSCDVETTDGELIGKLEYAYSYPEVIKPGEKGYYYQHAILSEATDAIDVTILPTVNAQASNAENVVLDTYDIEIYDGEYGGVKAKGNIKNTTSEKQGMVLVAVVLFDENDKPKHVVFNHIMEEIAPDDTVYFNADILSMPDTFKVSDVSRYEVYAYQIQLDY